MITLQWRTPCRLLQAIGNRWRRQPSVEHELEASISASANTPSTSTTPKCRSGEWLSLVSLDSSLMVCTGRGVRMNCFAYSNRQIVRAFTTMVIYRP